MMSTKVWEGKKKRGDLCVGLDCQGLLKKKTKNAILVANSIKHYITIFYWNSSREVLQFSINLLFSGTINSNCLIRSRKQKKQRKLLRFADNIVLLPEIKEELGKAVSEMKETVIENCNMKTNNEKTKAQYAVENKTNIRRE